MTPKLTCEHQVPPLLRRIDPHVNLWASAQIRLDLGKGGASSKMPCPRCTVVNIADLWRLHKTDGALLHHVEALARPKASGDTDATHVAKGGGYIQPTLS